MAKTKASSRRPKSAVDRERYTAELSTMQLVIGVCILLMFGLGCFLLGVLIGKFDPSLRDQMAAVGPGRTAEPPPAEVRYSPPEPEPSVQTTLPPEIRPPKDLVEERRPPTQPETPAQTPTQESEKPDPKPADTSTEQTATAAPPEPEEPPAATTTPKPQPAATAPQQTQPTVTAPATTPPPPAATTGKYGVQIIAVARPRAEGVKRDIEAKSDYKAEIIAIDGDRLCKVVVGRFQDERTALAARNDLRTKYKFADAYVIVLQ